VIQGGNSISQIYDQLYTPTGLILGAEQIDTPIIYVAMNYRLSSEYPLGIHLLFPLLIISVFGFAASDALFEEGNTNVALWTNGSP
jgi:hypothetical protein